MAISIYDTVALIGVVEQFKPPSSFLLDAFFPQVQYSETEFVAVDVYVGKRRMAPFCSPLVESRVVEVLPLSNNEFKPAYIKFKSKLDPKRPVRRMIGERIGGQQMSPAEREQANLAFELEEQVRMVNRRLEWMAAQALLNGSVTVVGDGVPSTVVNFGRDSSLAVTLTGGSRWGQAGVLPSESILDWQALVLKASGLPVTDVVFTPAAWKAFRKDPNVQDVIRSFANAEPSFAASGPQARIGGLPLGQWGPLRLWLYYDWFIDPATGTETAMLADGTVLLGSDQLMGERAFASIIDSNFNYQAMPYAPRSWVENDPAIRYLMMQSAPLVIPTQVNACLAATVI